MRLYSLMLALACASASPAWSAADGNALSPSRDWSLVASRSKNGAFTRGNPNARVKLVEYLSATCPHCARMTGIIDARLTDNYLRSGRVSYEVRPVARDPVDLVALLLSRCAGPRGFFMVLPRLLALQQDWVGRGFSFLRSHPSAIARSSPEVMIDIAQNAGLASFFETQGYSRPQLTACLSDVGEATLLAKMAKDTWTPGFPGTPTFEVNGVRDRSVSSWETLEASLVRAGA